MPRTHRPRLAADDSDDEDLVPTEDDDDDDDEEEEEEPGQEGGGAHGRQEEPEQDARSEAEKDDDDFFQQLELMKDDDKLSGLVMYNLMARVGRQQARLKELLLACDRQTSENFGKLGRQSFRQTNKASRPTPATHHTSPTRNIMSTLPRRSAARSRS